MGILVLICIWVHIFDRNLKGVQKLIFYEKRTFFLAL